VAVVLFLITLLSGSVQVVQTNGNNVVSAVGRGVPDGFVLAHEGYGDLRGDAAEGTGVGAYVDEVPCARVGEVCLDFSSQLLALFCVLFSGLWWCTFPTYCDIVNW
jgi:hypothetical protein